MDTKVKIMIGFLIILLFVFGGLLYYYFAVLKEGFASGAPTGQFCLPGGYRGYVWNGGLFNPNTDQSWAKGALFQPWVPLNEGLYTNNCKGFANLN